MKKSVDETLPLNKTLAAILARTKVVPEDAYAGRQELEDLHREHRRRRYLIAECGLPEKEASRLLGRAPLLETPALAYAREFREAAMEPEGPRLLVLAGPCGVGKTTAAAWLIGEGPPRPYMLGDVNPKRDPRLGSSWPLDRHPRFIAASELAMMSPIDHLAHDALRRCSVLGIDDLGMEFVGQSGAAMARLDALIDARYRQHVWTVITTNCTDDQFRASYGERITDRVNEVGEFCYVPGTSLR